MGTRSFISYRDAVIGNSIWDGLKRVFAILSGSSILSFAANIISAYYQIFSRYRIPVTIITFLLSLWLFLELFCRLSRNIPNLPPIYSRYIILKRDIRFEYGKSVCKYSLKARIRANQNGVDRFCGKYIWTGSEKNKLRSTKREHSLIELARKDTYIEYELLFNQSYKKGKVIDFEIYGDFKDFQNKFVPFFNTIISEPTNELNITVCIPPQ